MSAYGGKDLASAFRTVRSNTLKIAEEIPEDKYDMRASADTRTVGQLLTHIALSPTFAYLIHSQKVSDFKTINFMEMAQKVWGDEAKPRSKAETIALLKAEGDKFATFLDGLSDDFLAQSVAMPPGDTVASKTRFELLLSPKEHEMHHRGQLMLMQRMAGLVPHLTRDRQARMAQAQAAQTQQAARV